MDFRTGLRPLTVCSALFAFAPFLSAQAKVAVVNLQQAVFDSAEIKKANDDMQAQFKPRQDEIDRLNKEIAALAQQLQTGQSKLTPQQEADLTAQGQRKQRELQRKQDDLQSDANTYRNDVLSKSSQKMSEVVRKLAEAKGLDLVIDTSTAIFFKPALDITKEAVAEYDKLYPAKPSAPAPAPAK